MTYNVRLTAPAQRDYYQAQAYCDAKAPEQTGRFIDEFFRATRRLEDFPYSGPVRRKTARRLNLRIFPYQIWYRVDDDKELVQVIAVLHHRQDPAHLDNRLGDEG